MSQPSFHIVYTPVSTTLLLDATQCSGFVAEDVTRGNDNLATSGKRERVVEATDVLISFTLPAVQVGANYKAWAAFARWAQQGHTFAVGLGVSTAGAQTYNAVLEQMGFSSKRIALGVYSLGFKFRIDPDSDAPADAGEVMNAFWGLT